MKHIIFFPGYAATRDNTRAWMMGIPSGLERTITTYAWTPGTASDAASTVHGFGGPIAREREIIDKALPGDEFIIVGHSSGCAAANALAGLVRTKNVRLVCLDGFVPSAAIRAKVPTQIWAAKSKTAVSRNYFSMKSAGGKDFRELVMPTGQTSWSMHFALVNLNVPSNLGGYPDFVKRGYQNCKTFTGWL